MNDNDILNVLANELCHIHNKYFTFIQYTKCTLTVQSTVKFEAKIYNREKKFGKFRSALIIFLPCTFCKYFCLILPTSPLFCWSGRKVHIDVPWALKSENHNNQQTTLCVLKIFKFQLNKQKLTKFYSRKDDLRYVFFFRNK